MKETGLGLEDAYYHGSMVYGEKLTETQKSHRRALYYGEVTMVDHWIGFLLDKVRNLGLLDNTLIVFMSDHGTLLGEYEIWGKPPNSMYESLIKLPLIMRFPRKEYAGKRVKGFVQNHDLLPTLLKILGIRRWPYLDEQINGLDASSLINGEKEEIRQYIVCGYEIYTCVGDHEWHYIISDQWEDPPERFWRGHRLLRGEWLFDLANDSGCNLDIADKYPDKVKMMRERLRELLQKHNVHDIPMKTYLMYPENYLATSPNNLSTRR